MLKMRRSVTKEDTDANVWPPHAHTHTSAHTYMHTHTQKH